MKVTAGRVTLDLNINTDGVTGVCRLGVLIELMTTTVCFSLITLSFHVCVFFRVLYIPAVFLSSTASEAMD